mmetsp:Transcript_27115/g.45102  ORF Transcript_27115/g.45102 Transcript_27115/m.45102 type:complete len:115 (+) Transcript_27115:409-753(+)
MDQLIKLRQAQRATLVRVVPLHHCDRTFTAHLHAKLLQRIAQLQHTQGATTIRVKRVERALNLKRTQLLHQLVELSQVKCATLVCVVPLHHCNRVLRAHLHAKLLQGIAQLHDA